MLQLLLTKLPINIITSSRNTHLNFLNEANQQISINCISFSFSNLHQLRSLWTAARCSFTQEKVCILLSCLYASFHCFVINFWLSCKMFYTQRVLHSDGSLFIKKAKESLAGHRLESWVLWQGGHDTQPTTCDLCRQFPYVHLLVKLARYNHLP